MDRSIKQRFLRLSESFSRRTEKLSAHSRKKISTVLSLFLALLCGVWAHSSTSEEARLSWLLENPPSEETWGEAFHEKGFRKIESDVWWEKSSAEFPPIKATSPRVYLSEDKNLLILNGTNGWEAWSPLSNPPAAQQSLLNPLGIGWDALTIFKEKIQNPKISGKSTKIATSAHREKEWRDPRQIVF